MPKHRCVIVSIILIVCLTACIDQGFDEHEDADELTFRGYDCTVDCSGHEAGYNWAEERGITDPDNCGGRSQSFIEGCIAYAEESGDSY